MALPQNEIYTVKDIYALPDGQRVELTDGQMYIMAPPKRIHQQLVSQFAKIIGAYIDASHGNCEVYPAPFASQEPKDEVEKLIDERNHVDVKQEEETDAEEKQDPQALYKL